jgi:release factor glutamine methyltransferase
VGTGSGCIAITLALELKRTVFAVDIARRALEIARGNAQQLGADVRLLEGDLLTAVGSAALVVSNPPYVPAGDQLEREVRDWEPGLALFGGDDGLDVWRRLVPQAARVLTPGGWLIGEIDARAEMAPLFDGWREFQVLPDLAGRPRIVRARR